MGFDERNLIKVDLPDVVSRSRTPSRSPHRSVTEPPIHRSSSLQHSNDATSMSPPITPPTSNTFPSATPGEPTINEEAAGVVARSMKASGSQRNGTVKERSRGRMVGDWQLQKTLGAGSMGKVKLGTNVVSKEKVSQVSQGAGVATDSVWSIVRHKDHSPV